MDVIFTDLDCTLLDPHTYDWSAARPAIERLNRRGIPWVLVTSKTCAEVEFWRQRLEHHHPFIVENGGAAYLPSQYFPQPVRAGKTRGGYEVIEWGVCYSELVRDLRSCSVESHCRVYGFNSMTAREIAAACEFSLEQAALAKQREYDEPFLVYDAERTRSLVRAIAVRGRKCARGSRFWHICGLNDKGCAVAALSEIFRAHYGPIRTIGLGDGLNDASFLASMDVPVLIRSQIVKSLKARVPHGLVTQREGPEGWNEAVLALIGGEPYSSQVAP